MTVAVAFKGSDGWCVGADTATFFGNTKMVMHSKLMKCDKYVMALAGSCRVCEIVRTVATEFNSICSKKKILEFRDKLFDALRGSVAIVNDAGDARDADFSILIAGRQRCWLVSSDFTIMPVRSYFAIGAGEAYAIGALSAAMRLGITSSEAVCRAAVKASIEHCCGCGGTAEIARP